MNEQKNGQETEKLIKDETNENSRPKKKKYRLRKFLIFIIIIGIVWWFNNFTIKTSKFKVYSDKISSDIRIAVISDLHASKFGIGSDAVYSKIDNAEPDIVFILGDMYSRSGDEKLRDIPVQLVSKLTDNGYPVYFVPGEHDTAQEYLDAMSAAKAHIMDYRSESININGSEIQILGIDNVYYSSTFDLNNAFSLDENRYTILMAHIPNYDKFAQFGADLTLCGDTHGGIIQLPFEKGPVYYAENGEWFPELNGTRSDIYDKGMFPYSGGTMFITSGIGGYPVPARFNNRPEVAIIDILPE